jgi:membrane protease YdiL (CAAX protease family)
MVGEAEPETQDTSIDPRAAWREAITVYAVVMVGCAIVMLLARALPALSEYLYLGFPALFLAAPTWVVWKHGDEYEDYGLVAEPLGKGLAYYAGLALLVFPVFIVGFVLYYRFICGPLARVLPLPRYYGASCRRFVGAWKAAKTPTLDWGFAERVASQLIVIALPEEYFFRGFLQTRLEQVWAPRRRLLGGALGWALVVASLLFALGHVITDFNPLRLAVFFPSLLFGWLRSATGALLASVLFHASCNVLIDLLNRSFFG